MEEDRTPTPSGSRKGSGKKSGGKTPAKHTKKDAKKTAKTPPPPVPENEGPPPQDIVPLFMATKTQEIFQCICDENVTEESPFKLIKKEDIVADMRNRAAISDFHPVKQIVLDYPGEDLLVVYDPDFKFGQNFYLCVTEEAKNRLINPEVERAASSVAGRESVTEEDKVYVYAPPEPKEWIDQGSQAEVGDEMVLDTRPKIRFCASRVRREFGASISFEDRDADIGSADQGLSASYTSCASYDDSNFAIKKMELDFSVQAVPEVVDGFSQTDWKHPVNSGIQYEPRTISKEDAEAAQSTKEYSDFIHESAVRFDLALQQNIIMDVFFDDWKVLGEDDANFGSKSDSHLKEYQSFTDLQYSKDKTVSCVDWHPQIKGVMAVACCERFTFDERVDNANKLLMNPSLVLIWSFADPIHPQLLLEGPDDIYCFKFCPTNPNIVAGGCINGQLVLWDISEYADRISSNRGSSSNSSQKKQAMFGEEVLPDTPTVRYCAVSAIENSHRNIITSVEWVPDHLEYNRMGIPVENRLCESCQIITCGTDGHVMIWDTRPSKTTPSTTRDQLAEKKAPIPFGVSQTYKHLDLTWKPLLKLTVAKLDSSGDYSPMKFSIPERQGARDHVPAPTVSKNDIGTTKVSSAKNQKPLEGVCTKYFIGTEDGEVVYADFKLEKDSETGKANVPKPTWAVAPHDGAVCTLQRSPFFNDLILSVGGWTFGLWMEEVLSSSILQSKCAQRLYTAGHWSLTRPAVFFLGTKDGNVEVWDLLDRTHEPIMVQNVTAVKITQIVPCIVSKKQHLLAVSDNIGTLHILEIPWTLRHPASKEKNSMQNYLDREAKRIQYFEERSQMREAGKDSAMAKKKQMPKSADRHHLDEEEREEMYENYLKLEKKLLQELGLIEEDKSDLI